MLLLSVMLLSSCTEKFTGPGFIEEEPQEGSFILSPPEFDIELTRAARVIPVRSFATDEGVSVNILERLWVGASLNKETDPVTRATWNDIVWETNYADIGLFTVPTSDVDAAVAANNYSGLTCFPFYRSGTAGGGYELPPLSNGSAQVDYQYYNANFKVNARDRKLSTEFFNRSNGEPLNFYGYFPYQQQTRGKQFTTKTTSICKLYRADLHEVNLTRMPFSFMASQTSANLREHDVMYSVSEDGYSSGGDKAHPRNRYGNRGKIGQGNGQNNANIHMRFVHAFCRLQFKISNGTFRNGETSPVKLSGLYVAGKKVFVDGHINLIEGTVIPITASKIERTLDNGQQVAGPKPYVDIRTNALEISMIVQPTGRIETLDDFVIVCEVDGVEYKCPLPINTELRPNHVYDINLDLSPETTIRINSGGGSLVSLFEGNPTTGQLVSSINEGGTIFGTFAETLVVLPHTGWNISKVFKNGAQIPALPAPEADGSYIFNLQLVENEVTTYDVVCIPDVWYKHIDRLRVHLDAKLNSGFTDESAAGFKQQIVSTWKDISYNGNDAYLYNFSLMDYCVLADDTAPLAANGTIDVIRSGWDTKGLKFDGIDDYVVLPGTINNEYTMSFYICLAAAQQNPYPRLVSEGTGGGNSSYPGYHMRGGANSRLSLVGHGVDAEFAGSPPTAYSGRNVGKDILQMDFVYKSNTITAYLNGVQYGNPFTGRPAPNPQEFTSLGGLLNDVSRHIQATYYSFMLYDVALTPAEIIHNYNINKSRYGITKTD